MQITTRGYADRAAAKAESGTPIRFIAATDAIARDGLVIDANAWQLANYENNPVFLWAHDYGGFASPRPPIGRCDNLHVQDGKLLCDVTFDQGDDFATQIERKYRSGFLNSVSVGWDTQEMSSTDNPNVAGRVTKAELLDISAVPVPGDPGALIERQKRAYGDMGREFLKLAGEDSAEPNDPAPTSSITPAQTSEPPAKATASATWSETSADMVSLFRPFAQRPDDARLADHQRLSRAYARHKKTPPEFLTQDALDALSGAEVRGLFLEGEPELHAAIFAAMETRAGAVLSQRNLDDLKQIVTLAQGVIDRASKEATSDHGAKPKDDPDEPPGMDMLALIHQELLKGKPA